MVVTGHTNSQQIVKITELDSVQWNALVPDDAPFARHEFLAALEDSGCVTPENGWLPQHIVINKNNKMIAAMPFYIKGHSYGEYVFDWAWADAYHRHGYEYYPKGLCAIPFTPASCPKLLIAENHDYDSLRKTLISTCLTLSQQLELSSVHSLFLNEAEQHSWQAQNFLNRTGFQFHWKNQNYASFKDYLSVFSSSKRKKIRHERNSVSTNDIEFKIKTGQQISEQNWSNFYRFYKNTINAHGAMAYLNKAFFDQIGDSMHDNIVMILAYKENINIASSLFFKGTKTLYGRYWGCSSWVKNLHFELCYYQAIEYCINNRLAVFEAGAQGEHKLSRGLLPVATHSSHWLRHPQFFQAIANHVEDESLHVESYLDQLSSHSPFKAA